MICPRSSSVPMTTISACMGPPLRCAALGLVEALNIHNAQMALAGWDDDGHFVVEDFPNQTTSQRRLIGDDVLFRDGIGLPQDSVDHLLTGPQVQAKDSGADGDPLAGNGQLLDKPRCA